jgi:NodT family efflux transporter outer membrane factor (OMF) lipoprotein
MRIARSLAACCAAGTLAACKVGPNFTPPHPVVPEQYAGVKSVADGGPAAVPSAVSPPASFWWREFHDPELDRLEERAAAGNLDLRAAFLRIVEARIQVQSARAQGLPSLNASASYSREQLGLAGIIKSQHINEGAASSSTTAGLISSLESPVNLYQLGFDASWELDLFGKVRRSVEAADARSAGAVESRNDLLVSLEAEVAQDYFQLRAGQMLRRTVVDQITAQREVFDLTQNRQQHGLAVESDVQSARAQLSTLQSELPPYEQSIATSRHALAVLTGQAPEAMDSEFGESGELPALPAVIPVGLPSTLARRRPDIRQSEAALHAATAQVGVSVASLYPDISLTGTFGLRNLSPGYLFDWDSKFYAFGPGISIPIFHGGALDANLRLSRAQAAESTLNYHRTVLNALEEVEDGLTNLHQDAARTASLRDTVTADQRALDVDLDAYRHGFITYVTVLTVQIQMIQAREQLAQALLAQNTDLVKLYKALGGGWEEAPVDSDAGRDRTNTDGN